MNREDEIEPDFGGLSSVEVEEDSKEGIKDGVQTFVFSATLSKDLQRNLKRHIRPKPLGKNKKNEKPSSTLGEHPQFVMYSRK